jgi:hypothetical protein
LAKRDSNIRCPDLSGQQTLTYYILFNCPRLQYGVKGIKKDNGLQFDIFFIGALILGLKPPATV